MREELNNKGDMSTFPQLRRSIPQRKKVLIISTDKISAIGVRNKLCPPEKICSSPNPLAPQDVVLFGNRGDGIKLK